MLTAGAAGIEMLACGTELVLRHFNAGSMTGVGATVFLGRLRLWGGALATAGSVVLIAYEFEDLTSAIKDKEAILVGAYSVRLAVAMALTASQAGLAIAAAGPMLKILAERAVESRFHFLFDIFVKISGALARKAVMLFLRRVLLRGTLITAAVSVVIAIFDIDALEKWCKRTIYRAPKFRTEASFADVEKELGALYGALTEII
ncbi:hypothetical protein ASD87_15690 [Achromobacter sp. Root170]|nr:hypothetical protein ASD87_15690 [Achromobacter sp. Root170]